MSERTVEERLAAVERALEADDSPAPGTSSGDVDERLDALEADVAELRAALQAVRGYVGDVRAVNDDVEQRADAALAKATAVQRALVEAEHRSEDATVDSSVPAQDGREAASAAPDRSDATTGRATSPDGSRGSRATGHTRHSQESTDDGPPAGPSADASGRPRRSTDGEGVRPPDAVAGRGAVDGAVPRLDGTGTDDGPEDDDAGLFARLREVL